MEKSWGSHVTALRYSDGDAAYSLVQPSVIVKEWFKYDCGCYRRWNQYSNVQLSEFHYCLSWAPSNSGSLFHFSLDVLTEIIFLFVTKEGWGWGDPGKPAFKLFSPAHRWIRGWAPRFAVRTRMHCCSLTSQLEGLIRDVHHCVTFCMQTSFLLTLSACLLTFPLASTSKTARKTRFVCRLEVG